MYCVRCGANIPDESRFCSQCGAKVLMPMTVPAAESAVPPVEEAGFERTRTLVQAAELASQRAPDQEWSYWDTPTLFSTSLKRLLRFCEKEDRRLEGIEDDEGVLYYLVSPGGAIGQEYTSEIEGSRELEWLFYSKEDGSEDLPETSEELDHWFDPDSE